MTLLRAHKRSKSHQAAPADRREALRAACCWSPMVSVLLYGGVISKAWTGAPSSGQTGQHPAVCCSHAERSAHLAANGASSRVDLLQRAVTARPPAVCSGTAASPCVRYKIGLNPNPQTWLLLNTSLASGRGTSLDRPLSPSFKEHTRGRTRQVLSVLTSGAAPSAPRPGGRPPSWRRPPRRCGT